MPSNNIIRFDADHCYYHVYSRGVNKSVIFDDDQDKQYYLYLISRHLSVKRAVNTKGYVYPHYRGRLELLAYCLMDNHFHLMLYQAEKGVLTHFMQSILTAYTSYYNRKYDRRGPLFESRYKASRIDNDAYLTHVSRYIHLNPKEWRQYEHSSLRAIADGTEPEWLQSDRVLSQHASRRAYVSFVADYEANKAMLSELKYQLADY
jgi:REP element-mobilizing transposase RayT